MNAFQDTREQAEQKVLMRMLSEIERNPTLTQRSLAQDLGIALGLMNQYLKGCITKGWVRASQVSPNRLKYFLTPDGFREKSHMVTSYLARSFTFFRDARMQCEEILHICNQNNHKHIALVGEGDLTDIFRLVAQSFDITVDANPHTLGEYSAVVITDTISPQSQYDWLKTQVSEEKILTLPLLHISRGAVS